MKVELKTKSNIAPLLFELQKIKKLVGDKNENGGLTVRFRGSKVCFTDVFKYEKIVSILKSLLKFNVIISSFSKKQIIQNSLNTVALNNIENSEEFLKIVNFEFKNYYKGKPEVQYYLLCSLSVTELPFDSTKINDSIITFTGPNYPDKFIESRSRLYQKRYNESEENKSLKLIVSVKERDFQDAFEKALGDLEVFRALLCLQTLDWRFPIHTKPINQVLYGGLFTLHHENGENVDDNFYWYDPNHESARLFDINKINMELLKKQTEFLILKLNSCLPKHSKTIKSVLNQYVSAYDQVNKDSCFLKAWTALENLLDTHRYDMLINRCVITYKNPDFSKVELESLKTCRNELVHEVNLDNGDRPEILTNCYIIHNFIFRQISLNLQYAGKIQSMSEYADYLDYLSNRKDIDELENKYMKFKDEVSNG